QHSPLAQRVMKPRIILADDHVLMVEGLQSLLASHVNLVASVVDGRALLEAANRLKPDIVILDISMPTINGLEAARLLRKQVPETKLIVLTMHSEQLYVSEALRLGVSAYVLKRSAASELLHALDLVQKGQKYISPLLG